MEDLLDRIRALGPEILPNELEALISLFLERDRPELVFDFMEGLELSFDLQDKIHRLVAEAHMRMGNHGEAALLLAQEATSAEDLKWACRAYLNAEDTVSIPEEILQKHAELFQKDGELFLCASATRFSGVTPPFFFSMRSKTFPTFSGSAENRFPFFQL